MKYRIVFIILSLFLLSGCEATYNLTISKESMAENTSIIETDVDRFDEDEPANYFYNLYSKIPLAVLKEDNIINPEGADLSFSKLPDIDYYKTSFPSSEVGINYKGKFKIGDYGDTSIVNFAAPLMKYEIKGNKIKINSNSLNIVFKQAPTLDKLTINIKISDYRVLENNADFKKGNTYTWVVSRSDAPKKQAKLKLGNSSIFGSIKDDIGKIFKNGSFVFYILIALVIIVVIVMVVYNYLVNKKEEVNEL